MNPKVLLLAVISAVIFLGLASCISNNTSSNPETLIENFNKAIVINPKNSQAYVGLGNVYTKKGDFIIAMEHFKKAIEINPNDASAYTGLGNVYARKGDAASAIENFKKAIKINPNDADAYAGLGNASADPAVAIENFNKAIAIDPNNPQIYVGLYYLYAFRNDADSIAKKEEALKKLEKLDKAFAEALRKPKVK